MTPFRKKNLGRRGRPGASYDAALLCGQRAFDAGDYGLAANRFRRAARLQPASVDAHVGLAMSLCERHQWKRARREIEEAIKLQPDDSECHFVLANILRGLRRFRDAVKEYANSLGALESDELGSEAELAIRNNLGVTYLDLGLNAEAKKSLYRALDIGPEDPDVLQNLALAESRLGDFELSSEHFWKAGSLDPSRWAYIAGYLRSEKRLREAGEAERHAIEIDPGNADNYHDLGNILREAGHFEEAIGQFEMALGLEPRRVGSMFQMALCFADLGHYDRAEQALQRALALEPSSDKISRALALLTARSTLGKNPVA